MLDRQWGVAAIKIVHLCCLQVRCSNAKAGLACIKKFLVCQFLERALERTRGVITSQLPPQYELACQHMPIGLVRKTRAHRPKS